MAANRRTAEKKGDTVVLIVMGIYSGAVSSLVMVNTFFCS